MYESILKMATDDIDFSFKVRSTPFPVTNEVKARKDQGNAAVIIFMTAVAQGMMLTTICGILVKERIEGSKHS
jgi:hypothetical protein